MPKTPKHICKASSMELEVEVIMEGYVNALCDDGQERRGDRDQVMSE